MQKKKKKNKDEMDVFTHIMSEELHCDFWQDLVYVVSIYTRLGFLRIRKMQIKL